MFLHIFKLLTLRRIPLSILYLSKVKFKIWKMILPVINKKMTLLKIKMKKKKIEYQQCADSKATQGSFI